MGYGEICPLKSKFNFWNRLTFSNKKLILLGSFQEPFGARQSDQRCEIWKCRQSSTESVSTENQINFWKSLKFLSAGHLVYLRPCPVAGQLMGLEIQFQPTDPKQNKTKQNKAKQSKTKQNKAKQDKTRKDKTRQDKTRQDRSLTSLRTKIIQFCAFLCWK